MHVAALSHGMRPTDGQAPATPSYGADALSLAMPAHGFSTVLVWKRRRWSRRYHVDEDAPLPRIWMWVGERCEERAQGASRRSSTYKSGADEFERIRAMVICAAATDCALSGSVATRSFGRTIEGLGWVKSDSLDVEQLEVPSGGLQQGVLTAT